MRGNNLLYLSMILIISLNMYSCGDRKEAVDPGIQIITDSIFSEYWYNGLAEITTYRLSQGHYGKTYEGVATLIFVTEDFDIDKQVKPDLQEVEGQEILPVLKLNKEKRFLTGIYPYTMMTSVFSPITGDHRGRGLKITSSVQEWCGQTFSQWNRNKSGGMNNQSFSYFERQGDRSFSCNDCWLEDELWTLLRLAPQYLPLDTFPIVSGSLNLRERVASPSVNEAYASKRAATDSTEVYDLYITEINRRLRIEYKSEFPHQILSWQEEFFRHGEKVVHRAEKYMSMQIDYWNRSNHGDSALYRELMPFLTVH